MKKLAPVIVTLILGVFIVSAIFERQKVVEADSPKIDPLVLDKNFQRVQEVFGHYDKNFKMLAAAIDEHTKAIKELQGKKKK